ncbi:MAG: hypothetical protein Q8O55_00660, partial [Dehalococcoidales bacterium]|nr:hypothetical protein [Dehalococcoidales bacterium]
MGDTTAGFDPLDIDFDSTNYYLEVEVSSDSVNFQTLQPRQRIVSSGFAINADSVHGGRFINANGVGQFGGLATVAHSRFGIGMTTHALAGASDLLIGGILEVDSQAFFDAGVSVSSTFEAGTIKVGTLSKDSGNIIIANNASASLNFEIAGYASASAYFGAGLTDCDGTVGNKALNWSAETGTFSCTDDDVGSGGTLIEIRESSVISGTNISSISFEAGHFNISFSGLEAIIKLDWANGPASRAFNEIITGFWNFTAASTQLTGLELINNASIGGNVVINGNTDLLGTLAVTGRSDFSSHASISGNFESTGTIKAASFSGDGAVSITTGSGDLTIGATGNVVITPTGNLITLNNAATDHVNITGNASVSSTFESAALKTDAISNSTGTLTINAFTLGGPLTGNSQNITGVADLSVANASGSGTFEALVGKFATLAIDSGIITIANNATASLNFEVIGYASASQLFGATLSQCTSTQKLEWSNGLFACVEEQASINGVKTEEGGTSEVAAATIFNFNADDFIVTASSSEAIIAIDYASSNITRSDQNETITGFWTFNNSVSVSGSLELTSAASKLGINVTNTNQTLEVGGTASISGASTFGSTVNVAGATTLSSTLGVTGLSTFSGGASVALGFSPTTDDAVNLGNPNLRFRTGYLSTSLGINSGGTLN